MTGPIYLALMELVRRST